MKTDNHDISFPLAVWLSYDDYDYDNRKNYISVTSLMKPLRQLILKIREENNTMDMDITDMLKAKIGSAIHAVNELAWADKQTIIKALIVKQEDPKLIERFRINGKAVVPLDPKTDDYIENPIEIYIEQRNEKAIKGFIIGGKYDLIWDGNLSDIKSTSTFTYTSGNKDKDFVLQGSMYRWLNPDKITKDKVNIEFIFTDWNANNLGRDGYPTSPAMQQTLPMLSMEETEDYIERKLDLLVEGLMLNDDELPKCTDKDLWISGETWQYFTKEGNSRAAKNFSSEDFKNPEQSAKEHLAGKMAGVIKKKPQKAKACGYCAVSHVCSQYKELLKNNLI